MDFHFQPPELRVLGCLIEKRFSTPDQYPLTLNSLVTACNQTSNRDPVVHFDQHVVDAALKSTRVQGYSLIQTSADARVARFKENLCDKLSLSRPQAAIMAELVLRGPQTPGELRQRTSRMHEFGDLGSVQAALQALADREQPLVVELPRQPGKREIRYAHLLAGPVEIAEFESAPAESDGPGHRGQSPGREETVGPSQLAALEERVAALEETMQRVLAELRVLRSP